METYPQRSSPLDGENRRPTVVGLDEPAAEVVELAGAKAAALARSTHAGLPVLPGFVLTTAFDATTLDHDAAADTISARQAWHTLTDDGRRRVGRSVVGDQGGHRVELDGGCVRVAARCPGLGRVRRCGARGAGVAATRGWPRPDEVEMAVLVQPFLVPAWGGVLFGVDPVSERPDRMVVSAVAGGPDRLVSGEVDGWTATLTRKGKVVTADAGDRPGDAELRELAALAVQLEHLAGRPQDIEWAIETTGTLRLLQSRPITTLHGPVDGPVYGPGPLAETFPVALAPLEEDLWLDPMRDGLRHALRLLGGASRAAVDRAPLVISVGGRPAVDLVLLGADPRRRSKWRLLDPRPGFRRLSAAWRVGRLTGAMPDLADDLMAEIDDDLLAVPALDDLAEVDLLQILHNTPPALKALHGHEALAGALLRADQSVGAATLALDVVRAASTRNRRAGRECDDVLEASPIALALIPPRIPPTRELPTVDAPSIEPDSWVDHEPTLEGITREALRMRVRWVQELSAASGSRARPAARG